LYSFEERSPHATTAGIARSVPRIPRGRDEPRYDDNWAPYVVILPSYIRGTRGRAVASSRAAITSTVVRLRPHGLDAGTRGGHGHDSHPCDNYGPGEYEPGSAGQLPSMMTVRGNYGPGPDNYDTGTMTLAASTPQLRHRWYKVVGYGPPPGLLGTRARPAVGRVAQAPRRRRTSPSAVSAGCR